MKAIVYESNTGFTEKYAKLLSEETGLPAYPLKKAPASLKSGEVFFMSWLFAGGLKRLKKARGRFRLAGVAAVGMAPPTEQALSDAIARNHLSDVKTFYLQGGFDINKLHGPSRLMMKTMEKSMAKKSERTQEEEETLDMLKNGMDRVDRSNLAPILAWMNPA
jgi:hypothetical protein